MEEQMSLPAENEALQAILSACPHANNGSTEGQWIFQSLARRMDPLDSNSLSPATARIVRLIKERGESGTPRYLPELHFEMDQWAGPRAHARTFSHHHISSTPRIDSPYSPSPSNSFRVQSPALLENNGHLA